VRARLPAFLLVVALFVLFGVAAFMSFAGEDPGGPQPRRIRGMDLVQYWVAGEVLDEGHAAELYDARLHKPVFNALYPPRPPRYPVGYPPPIYQAFACLSPALDYFRAAKALMFGMAALHVAAVLLLVRHSALGAVQAGWALPLLFAAPSAVSLVMSGQLGGVWELALAAGLVLRARGRPAWAGVVLGVLWVKPTLAVPVALAALLLGDAWLLGGMVLGGTVVLVASLLAPGGPEAWGAFLHRIADPGAMAEDFWVLWRRQGTLRTLAASLAPARDLAPAFGWFGSAIGVVGAVAASRSAGREAEPLRADLRVGAVLAWSLLAAPHLLEYDLGMHNFGLLVSVAWIAAGRARWPRVGGVAVGLAWLAAAFVVVNQQVHVNLTALSVAAWATWTLAELWWSRTAAPAA
jgi:hypothetical protein